MKVLQAEVKVTWIHVKIIGKGIHMGKYKRQYKCL